VAAGDPVATGIVQSLAHPGGNITGLSSMNVDLGGKHLEMLREINPAISSIAVLFNPENSISALGWSEFRVLSQQTSVTLRQFEARSIAELDRVLEEIAGAHMDALAIMPDPIFTSRLKHIADFALKVRMPSIFHLKEFAKAGGLLSYGVDRDDLFRRAAGYVDKILKGARPAELPIEQPTKFELAVNLKTAGALGLTVPATLLGRADEVIE
jgi:putative ABC transport system substrate-binding protein